MVFDRRASRRRPGRARDSDRQGFADFVEEGYAKLGYRRTLRPMRNTIRLALVAIALLPASALAGANRDRGQDEVGPGPDEGPSYFGVVLDAAGKPVEDARVSATSRDGLAMVTRSNAAGAYSLPGFNKRINADEVKSACAKPGYRQVRVVRRPAPSGKPARAVETECRLQKS